MIHSLFQSNSYGNTQLMLTYKLEARVRLGIPQPGTVVKSAKPEEGDDPTEEPFRA